MHFCNYRWPSWLKCRITTYLYIQNQLSCKRKAVWPSVRCRFYYAIRRTNHGSCMPHKTNYYDFLEIIFIMVPLVGPRLISMSFDPVWLGVMISVNSQTSFWTPPFGFSFFYLKGVAPPEISTKDIYLGVLPFIGLQIIALLIFCIYPQTILWLPKLIFG